jgi:cell division protease FtsH
MVEYGDHEGEVFLARDISRHRNYSESTAQKIDDEIRHLIDWSYSEAKRMILDKKDALEAIAQALLEYETLEASHIMDLIEHGEMKDPPNMKRPPEVPDEFKKPDDSGAKEEEEEGDDGTLPGEVVGAPA